MIINYMNISEGSIGLALGGGAALGAAHVGVLRAIEEMDTQVSYIAGTSIGAMVGAFYAFGIPVKEIEKNALDLKWPDISGLTLSKMGLLSNHELGKLLDERLGNVIFEDAQIPLSVVATDIASGEKVLISEGDVSDAVKASTCVPVVFEPVEMNGRLLVDGGLKESVPVSAVKNLGADYIIGVDLKSNRKYRRPENILDVMNNTLEIALQHLANVNPKEIDLLIQPQLGEFSRTDIKNTKEMIKRGYSAAMESFKKVELDS